MQPLSLVGRKSRAFYRRALGCDANCVERIHDRGVGEDAGGMRQTDYIMLGRRVPLFGCRDDPMARKLKCGRSSFVFGACFLYRISTG